MTSYLTNEAYLNNDFSFNNLNNLGVTEMALIFYDAAVNAGASNGVVAGLFVPIANLPMVSAGEFATGVAQATKESKFLLALGTKLLDYYSTNSTTILGFTASRTQASVSDKIVNWTYNFLFQKVAKLVDQSFDVLPLPSSGANNGIGGIELNDVFANAAVVAAEGAISGEGVLIPNSDILGGFSAALNADKRDYLEGLITFIAKGGVTIRSTSNASGIVALTAPNNYTAFTLPTAATQATDPTTGLLLADLGKIATVEKTMSYAVQLEMNSSTGAFDVRSVVS